MIRILCIGKMKDKALHMLEEEYLKRLKAFTKVEVLEVRDEPNERIEREKEAAMAKEKEGERALAQIKDSDFVILLDLHGSVSQIIPQESWSKNGIQPYFIE